MVKKRYIPRPVLKLVNEMRMEPEPWLCWTVECGLHSGIPPCCIMFYTMMWTPASQQHHMAEDFNQGLHEEDDEFIHFPGEWAYLNYRYMLQQYRETNDPINYIPCPSCFLTRKFIKLKDCDCHRKKKYPLLH